VASGDHLIRFAHSLPETRDEAKWERLDAHLRAVASKAADFAHPFGLAAWAQAAGLLHDIGKNSDPFQDYIRGKGPSPDHSQGGGERIRGPMWPAIGICHRGAPCGPRPPRGGVDRNWRPMHDETGHSKLLIK